MIEPQKTSIKEVIKALEVGSKKVLIGDDEDRPYIYSWENAVKDDLKTAVITVLQMKLDECDDPFAVIYRTMEEHVSKIYYKDCSMNPRKHVPVRASGQLRDVDSVIDSFIKEINRVGPIRLAMPTIAVGSQHLWTHCSVENTAYAVWLKKNNSFTILTRVYYA